MANALLITAAVGLVVNKKKQRGGRDLGWVFSGEIQIMMVLLPVIGKVCFVFKEKVHLKNRKAKLKALGIFTVISKNIQVFDVCQIY